MPCCGAPNSSASRGTRSWRWATTSTTSRCSKRRAFPSSWPTPTPPCIAPGGTAPATRTTPASPRQSTGSPSSVTSDVSTRCLSGCGSCVWPSEALERGVPDAFVDQWERGEHVFEVFSGEAIDVGCDRLKLRVFGALFDLSKRHQSLYEYVEASEGGVSWIEDRHGQA